jgi:hypothetical protein
LTNPPFATPSEVARAIKADARVAAVPVAFGIVLESGYALTAGGGGVVTVTGVAVVVFVLDTGVPVTVVAAGVTPVVGARVVASIGAMKYS